MNVGSSDTPNVGDNTPDDTGTTHADGTTMVYTNNTIASTASSGDWLNYDSAAGTYTFSFPEGIKPTRRVEVGTHVLERPFKLNGSYTAESLPEEEVKLNDVLVMDFVVYDSRSGITKKPNSVVAEGINRLIGKNIQFRHIDIKKNPYSMLGEVIGQPKIRDRIDRDTNQPFMEIEFPFKLEAKTSESVDLIQELYDLQKKPVDEDDYEARVGCSLGWVETAEEFLPYEVSITPLPRCNQCRSVNQTGRLLSSTAEKEIDNMDDDHQAEHDPKKCDVSGCAECKKANSKSAEKPSPSTEPQPVLNQKEDVIVSLNVENRELKGQVAELSEKLLTDAKSHDTLIASKEAENKELSEKYEALETEFNLAQTLPLRTEIAEDLMGLEGDEATAKIDTLASMQAEALNSYHQDLVKVKETVSSNAPTSTFDSDYEAPIIAGSSGTTPTAAKGKTAEEEAIAYMAESGIDIAPKKEPRMW